MEKTGKLIVSHKANLELKYGRKAASVFRMLEQFCKRSRLQQMTCELIYLDDPRLVERYNIKPVALHGAPEQFKATIDQLYTALDPDYIVLVGAQDIIPFQPLKNPARRLDEEEIVPSDLPYASNAPFSLDTKTFLSPTRVVGRIPDIPGSNDASYVRTILDHCTRWTPVKPSFYEKYFALSTVSWKGSTSKNIQLLFQNNNRLHYSPVDGPAFRKNILSANCHFINCHGAVEDPAFYGEKGNSQPEALFSSSLDGRVNYGTIVAAECCYGSQLFTMEEAGDMSISNKYLREGAIAFLGSSTVAYGPEDNLALADLITQYFLLNVFKGASTGRALLEARIQFLNDSGPYLDVMELKTYAQFMLLGDPSIHPVQAVANTVSSSTNASWINTRSNRRENLKAKGAALQQTMIPPVHSEKIELPVDIQPEIRKMLKANKMSEGIVKEVFVNKPRGSRETGKSLTQEVRYIAYSQKQQRQRGVDRKILMIKEKGNRLLGSRVYVSR